MSKIIIALLIGLSVGLFTPTTSTVLAAGNMSIAQLVELLISIGAISEDKAPAARTFVASASDQSTAISGSGYIQVFSPNTAVSWNLDGDTARSITWGSQGVAQVNISFVSGSKECIVNEQPVASKTTTNLFKVILKNARCFNPAKNTISYLTDGSYRVRVSGYDTTGNLVSDDSDALVKILPIAVPSIVISYPNGGETLIRKEDHVIYYKLKNVTESKDDFIYIYLIDNYGNIAFSNRRLLRTDNVDLADLPSSLPIGAYRVKLKLITKDDVEIEDLSDSPFWITSGV